MRSPRIANEDYDIKAQVGSYIEIDQWEGEGKLLEHDDTEWKLCDFRISAGGGLYRLATRVEVTGSTLQRRSHAWNNEWVRVRVILVADPDDIDWYTGERMSEDAVLSGWMLVTDREKVQNPEKAERNWQKYLAGLERVEAEERERKARQEAKRLAEERRLAGEIRAAKSRAAALEV